MSQSVNDGPYLPARTTGNGAAHVKVYLHGRLKLKLMDLFFINFALSRYGINKRLRNEAINQVNRIKMDNISNFSN